MANNVSLSLFTSLTNNDKSCTHRFSLSENYHSGKVLLKGGSRTVILGEPTVSIPLPNPSFPPQPNPNCQMPFVLKPPI